MTMAVSSISPVPSVAGDLKLKFVELDISGYTTDGESVAASVMGFGRILGMLFTSSEKGYMFAWNRTTEKIMVFTAAATQASGTTDCGTVCALVVGY